MRLQTATAIAVGTCLHHLIDGVVAQVSSTATTTAAAQQPQCSLTVSGGGDSKPLVKPGYQYRLVGAGLKKPRSLIFDTAGHLLVVQQLSGIVALQLRGEGACLTASEPTTVVNNSELNHGIAFSHDGRKLYASTAESLYEWDYNPLNASVTSEARTLVTGMNNTDHTTRTLLYPRHVDGLVLVSRGSSANWDPEAGSVSSGHSQLKAFNVTNATSSPYDYSNDGLLIGWGLRNSVGVAEHPATGGIFSVENSSDEIERDGRNVHEDNPAEEMNFHGYLNGTHYANQGRNYGYPSCLAAWRPDLLADSRALTVGTQFAIDDGNLTDAQCREEKVAPRLSFAAHMAPMDIVFDSTGDVAWVSFHGSWDRTEPIGYKLAAIEFSNGQPIAAPNSTTAAIDIFTNSNLTACPGSCFRPVGLAWTAEGNLLVASDSTGELFQINRADGKPVNGPLADETVPTTTTASYGGVTSATSSAMATRMATPPGFAGWHWRDVQTRLHRHL